MHALTHLLRLATLALLTLASVAQTWQPRASSPTPSPRNSLAGAFDVYRGVSTVFGGFTGTTPLGDTWEWNGFFWSQRTPPASPPARWGHGMAFDTRRGRAVLFGGFDGSALRNDTWEWDGFTWAPRTTANAPSPRAYFGLAYDSVRGVVVAFGGANGTASLGDTWEYDGFTWTQRATGSAPSARSGAAMAFDEIRRETLLFGGGDGGQVLGDLWAWNGSTWSVKAATGPSARQAAAFAFDGNCGRAVLHGGADAAFATNFGDSWSFDGLQWTPVGGAQPPARHGAVLVHDAQRGTFVMYGGRDASGFRSDLWELGATCTRTMTTVAPPRVGQTAQFRYDYPPQPNGVLFDFTFVTLHQGGSFPITFPGFPSIGLCRVDLGNQLAQAVVLLDGSGSAATALPIPATNVLVGLPFDVQSLEFDYFTSTLRWSANDAEVTTAPSPPVAAFTMSPASGPAPLLVTFTNSSQLGSTYAWDFGDGTTSTLANPAPKTYVGGSYTVTLTVTGPGGTATVSHPVTVTGASALPSVWFRGTPRSGNAPLTVQFTDTSTQFPIAWQWDFDDDGVVDSTQQNPTWTYTSNGSYPVRLVTTNALGSASVTRLYVQVGPISVTPDPALNMLAMTPGTFLMGRNQSNNYLVWPVHSVTITQPFWIGRYEVTQAQYQAVVGSNPSTFVGPQLPVNNVSWDEAVAYCRALTTLERAARRVPVGYEYRLPSDAEWEYCCRAGTQSNYSTGATISTSQANFSNTTTVAVGSYAPNAFGLYDVHGNVAEWCLDAVVFEPYPSGPVRDPVFTWWSNPSRRGGDYQFAWQSADRDQYPPATLQTCGLRVVLAPICAARTP